LRQRVRDVGEDDLHADASGCLVQVGCQKRDWHQHCDGDHGGQRAVGQQAGALAGPRLAAGQHTRAQEQPVQDGIPQSQDIDDHEARGERRYHPDQGEEGGANPDIQTTAKGLA